MVQILPSEDFWGDIGRSVGSGAGESYLNRSDEMALQKAIGGLKPDASPQDVLNTLLNTNTYGNEAKQNILKNYLGVQQMEELKRHAKEQEEIAKEKNRIAASKQKTQAETEDLEANYRASGMPDYEAKLMANPDVTPATKQQISKQHADLVARGIRQPQIPPPPQGAESPTLSEEIAEAPVIAEEQKAAIEPVKEEWPDIPPPKETTPAEREKWRTGNQRENNKLLKEIKGKTNAHRNSILRLDRASTLNDTGKVANGAARILIDPATGEMRPEASILGLVNKETQAFVKTINDFLIDAKNYFGARVTNFDVNSFKSRLPSLLNTEEGRRLIIQQMKLMEELQLVYDKELEDGLHHYGRNGSYSDIDKVVSEKVSARQEAIISKLNDIDQAAGYMDVMAKNPKYKNAKLFQDPETGKFKAFRPDEVKIAKEKGWIPW